MSEDLLVNGEDFEQKKILGDQKCGFIFMGVDESGMEQVFFGSYCIDVLLLIGLVLEMDQYNEDDRYEILKGYFINN